MGLGADLELSSDGKFLTATYPGVDGVFIFNVEEMRRTIEVIKTGNLAQEFKIDRRTNSGSNYSNINTPKIGYKELLATPVTFADLLNVPIDDINPNIDIAARFEITKAEVSQNKELIEYGVPKQLDGNPISNSPIGILSNVRSVNIASKKDWIELHIPNTNDKIVNPNPSIADLTPQLSWEFDPSVITDTKQINEVELFVSVFDQGNGLLPEWTPSTASQPGLNDYNPNRILTATWQNGVWTWAGGSQQSSFNTFELPNDRILTAGQQYHWAVRAYASGVTTDIETGDFITKLATPIIDTSESFHSVTILTRGAETNGVDVDHQFESMARHIAQLDNSAILQTERGLVLEYNPSTGKWNPDGTTDEVTKDQLLAELGNPLVLLPGWNTFWKSANNSGSSEAAADAFYASLVQLDLMIGGSIGSGTSIYDNQGALIRSQGYLFNSPLHFIGFGQGAVVNNEIIQRLGTDYPLAGGIDQNHRDLQMTSIDPQVPEQDSLNAGGLVSVNEPKIAVWKNITFADNYYQAVPISGKTNTRIGEEIPGADLNVNLSHFAGFAPDDGQGSPHSRALAWYAGTLNLSGSTLTSLADEKIYRRLGDLQPDNRSAISPETWYSPDYTGYPYIHGATNAPWEGIATGWFYSALGGGMNLRSPVNTTPRVELSVDNTVVTRMRGDFAVPTVFNGNFDAVTYNRTGQIIPGWSLYNGTADGLQKNLVNWTDITALAQYRTDIGYDSAQTNYALELGTGLNEITHSRFVVPDWGVLRFDLHTGDVTADATNKLRVTIQATDGSVAGVSTEINLQEARGTAGEYLADTRRIGYGEKGFETFTLDVPEYLRGKVATVSFVLDGGSPVYLDNVFFKSQHLLLGNPSEARKPDAEELFRNNYLLEKPQYALSYNADAKIPNWVSWQLNKSWLGNEPRPDASAFKPDEALPTDWDRVEYEDYTNSGYHRGHMTASSDRNRNAKDILSTYLMTNILPQHSENNSDSFRSAWYKFEKYLQNDLVKSQNKELYVIAGGWSLVDPPDVPSPYDLDVLIPNPLKYPDISILVPAATWKVVLILEQGQSIADITASTPIIALVTPNDTRPRDNDPNVPPLTDIWRDWTSWRVSVDEVENLTGLDFLTSIPKEIQDAIEQSISPLPIPGSSPTSFLLAEDTNQDNWILGSDSLKLVRLSDNISIRQDSIAEESTIHLSAVPVSTFQVGILQVDSLHTTNPQVSPTEISSTEIRVSQIGSIQANSTKVSSTQIDSTQISISEINPNKISSPAA